MGGLVSALESRKTANPTNLIRVIALHVSSLCQLSILRELLPELHET